MFNEYLERGIKIGRLPYMYYKGRSDIIDRYIQLSPGLRYLESQNRLGRHQTPWGVTFYSHDSYCYDYIMDVFDDSNRFIPLGVFMEEMAKEKKLNQTDQCPESSELLKKIRQLRNRPDWSEGPTEEEF